MPVRDLHPVNARVLQFARQRSLAADDQDTGREADFDRFGRDPRQRDQNGQGLLGLEDVARRLPVGHRAAAMKKLAVQALRPLDGLAGLGPHQCFELSCCHDQPPRRQRPEWARQLPLLLI